MTYILSAELDADAVDALDRYREYLTENADRFPAGAYALATSPWYFNSSDHRAPHDARLEELSISETGTGARAGRRSLEIRIRLLGAYDDGHIEFRYRDVARYRCELNPGRLNEGRGHRDWRYDEFRLSEDGRLVHEIEWWGRGPTGSWLIEAADVEFTWIPKP